MKIIRFKNKIKVVAGVVLSAVLLTVLALKIVAGVRAIQLPYGVSGAMASLNGEDSVDVQIMFGVSADMSIAAIQGQWTAKETEDTSYITLSELTGNMSGGTMMENDVQTGGIYWFNAIGAGTEMEADSAVWTAVYTVDKDTPAGDYTVQLDLKNFVYTVGGTESTDSNILSATIEVTRPVVKQEQTIVFKDSSGASQTVFNKYYGDEDFVVTVHPTEGEVAEYHPNDDGSGSIVRTVPNSNLVSISGVGSMDICARVPETDNYAETTACYTVNVSRRPLTINNVVVPSKTYDGTADATVSSVTFVGANLGSSDYTVSATLDGSGVGNRVATVTVSLSTDAAKLYTLDNNTISNIATSVTPCELTEDAYVSGPTQMVVGGNVDKSGFILYANNVALVKDTDYEVSVEGEGGNVGQQVTVTFNGIGNYSGGFSKNNIEIVAGDALTITSVGVPDKTYDGTVASLVNSVVLSGNGLVFGVDYTAEAVFDNPNVGNGKTVTVTVTLSDDAYINYAFADGAKSATATTAATITPFALTAENTTQALSQTEFTYSGESNEPTATVKVMIGGMERTLATGTDYTITYSDDTVNAGSKTATVVGKGNFAGTLAALDYEVAKATSPAPAEMTAELSVMSGQTLVGISGTRTLGFAWVNSATAVATGEHTYPATYTYNNDTTNYTTLNLNVPVYGLALINVSTSVTGEGGAITESLSNVMEGSEVTITLTPYIGYEVAQVLVGNDNLTSSVVDNKITFVAGASDMTVNVSYKLKQYSLTINGTNVTVDPSGIIKVNHGANQEVTIEVDRGYYLTSVLVNGINRMSDVSEGVITVTNVTMDTVISVIAERITYDTLDGDGQEHTINEDGTATFRFDADYELLFVDGGKVYVDGELVDEENYDSAAGSTVIKFKAQYMDSLPAGNHTVTVVFNNNGIATASFVVAEPEKPEAATPDTGAFMTEFGAKAGVVILPVIVLTGLVIWGVVRCYGKR